MGELYLRDNNLATDFDGTGPRRNTNDIYTAITEIIPRAPKSIKEHRLGYTVLFGDDKDANFIFKPEVQNKLLQKQLIARLSYNTEAHREVYILKTP